MKRIGPLDIDIINRLDEESFHLLFRLYYKALVGYARSIVAAADDAEDMVQDVMAHMAASTVHFDSRQALERYLFLSVRNRAINHLRHRKVEEKSGAVPLSPLADSAAADIASDAASDDPEEWLLREQLYHRLFATIDLLPPRSREVLLLVAQGKSNQEIAEALGMSVATVKTHKKRSMAFLRSKMGTRVADAALLAVCLASIAPEL